MTRSYRHRHRRGRHRRRRRLGKGWHTVPSRLVIRTQKFVITDPGLNPGACPKTRPE